MQRAEDELIAMQDNRIFTGFQTAIIQVGTIRRVEVDHHQLRAFSPELAVLARYAVLSGVKIAQIDVLDVFEGLTLTTQDGGFFKREGYHLAGGEKLQDSAGLRSEIVLARTINRQRERRAEKLPRDQNL